MCGWLAVGIAIGLLPVWSDTEWIKKSVIEKLTEMAGGPIQVNTLNLHLFPSPAVYVENISFESKDQDGVKFRANQVELEIGWRSLWDKQFVLTHMLLDQPELTLEVSPAESTDMPLLGDMPEIQGLVVQNGHLHLLRTVANQTTQAMHWENIQISITQLQAKGPSQFQLSGQIPNTQSASSLTLKGTLTLLEPDKVSSPNEVQAPFPATQIHAQLEGRHLNLGQFAHFISGHTLEPPIHTNANVQGSFSYILQQENDLLDIENFHVFLDDWKLTGQANITDLFHEFPRLHFSGSSSPLAIERLSSLLPSEWIPEDVQKILRDHQIVGTAELQQGTFHIPLNDHDHDVTETQGIVRVTGGQFLPALGQPLLTNVSGTVAFSPSNLQVSQVSGTIAPFTITTPAATLVFEEETVQLSVPTFQISAEDWNLNGNVEFTNSSNEPLTLTVSASAFPISIQRLANIIPEAWFPASVRTMLTERDIDGKMELLTGSVEWKGDDANTVVSEGVLRLTHGHILVDPNHPPLTNLSGAIAFNSDLVRIIDAKASIEESKLFVKEATIDWKDSDSSIDLYAQGALEAHDLYQALLRDSRSAALEEFLSLYHEAEGKVQFSSHIQGSLSNPSQYQILEGDLLLENIYLFPTSNGLPLRRLNGQLSFHGQGIRIQRFSGQFGDSLVDLKGQWSFQKDVRSSNLTLTSSLSSTDLQILFPAIRENFSTLEGPIDTTMSFSGTTLRPVYQTKFDLTNTTVTAKGLFHKPVGIPATIELKGSIHGDTAIRMTKGTLSIPPYTLEAQGRLSWADPPYVRGFLQTESGTGAMFPQDVIIGDGRLRLSSLGISWGLEGKNWDWTTWSMKGKVEGSNRHSESTTSNTNEEVQSASFQWTQKNQKGKGKITLSGIPIESFLAPQSASLPPVTGTTSLKTSLHMNLESSEQMQHSLTGKGSVQLQKGLIQTGPVLSKILGILNVPSLLMGKVNLMEEGLPFDELIGSFSIDKGLLTTKDLALKSPVLKLTAAGTYDLPTENLESMIAVSPFGAYSNLLKDIPLFGSLMKGERKGILTALFKVKGPRTKPQVTYLPMESFTGGLKGLAQFPIDMLKNIIPLPAPKKETTEQVAPTK